MVVNLYLTPLPFKQDSLENQAIVVIDVLRCTTSICAALQAGARGVIPVSGPGEAGELYSKIGSETAILAGEREGLKIDNFQLGNSPAEFTKQTVEGKTVILTTTNGTDAFMKARKAKRIVSCALVNVSRVAKTVAEYNMDITILCAGREGGFSIEDTLCGGMLIHLLDVEYNKNMVLNDASSLALLLYRSYKTTLKQAIASGEHGKLLASIGFGADIETAVAVDSIPIVPVMNDGRLVDDREITPDEVK